MDVTYTSCTRVQMQHADSLKVSRLQEEIKEMILRDESHLFIFLHLRVNYVGL